MKGRSKESGGRRCGLVNLCNKKGHILQRGTLQCAKFGTWQSVPVEGEMDFHLTLVILYSDIGLEGEVGIMICVPQGIKLAITHCSRHIRGVYEEVHNIRSTPSVYIFAIISPEQHGKHDVSLQSMSLRVSDLNVSYLF